MLASFNTEYSEQWRAVELCWKSFAAGRFQKFLWQQMVVGGGCTAKGPTPNQRKSSLKQRKNVKASFDVPEHNTQIIKPSIIIWVFSCPVETSNLRGGDGDAAPSPLGGD